jgi:hypothetical protein
METPVVYFYADEELTVSVNIRFPSGSMTEWYPQAATPSRGIRWPRVQVLPNARPALVTEERPSPYYHARETDAATLRVDGATGSEVEKFLFYRGIGSFTLPVLPVLRGSSVELINSSDQTIGTVLLLEKREGRVGFSVLDSLDKRASRRLMRPSLTASCESVEKEIETALVSHGLFPKEARAMVRTWASAWLEDGTRVFYIMPRPLTDAVLPMTLNPAPDDLVRVLVARADIITPEILADIRRVVNTAITGEPVPGETLAVLRRYRRFAEPLLIEVLGESYPNGRIQALIAACDAQSP